MNYKVLYRRYRPNNFNDLIGQDHIVTILKNSIKENKIAHAYIFSGPRGTGKTSTARIFAKAINCLDSKDGNACDKCKNCQIFGTSPDLIEIDAASNNGVEEIRELINNVKIMPTALKYKVYIIDEVHMLSTSAFNALLLTLEEPPEHVIFILATTNIESVPITIISRCQKFEFKCITNEKIVERLAYICKTEKIAYENDALNEIALLAEGSLRDALSILDQLSKNNQKITIKLITSEIGIISKAKIKELIDALILKDIDKIINIFNEIKELNVNYKNIIKVIIDEVTSKAIDSLKDKKDSKLSFNDYKDIVIELNDILNKININVNPYELIEMILLNHIAEKKEPPAKITKKDSPNLEEKSTLDIDLRINNCFAKASKECLKEMQNVWQKLITETTNMKLKGIITDTVPVVSSTDYAIITTTIKNLYKELNFNNKTISEELKKILNVEKKLVFINLERWEKEKNKYIENLKKGYKYKLKKEPIEKIIEKEDNLEELAREIFDKDKIEIV